MTQLVTIIHVDGDEYDNVQRSAYRVAQPFADPEELLNDQAPIEIRDLVAVLAHWDYGHENDDAAEVMGYQRLDEVQRLPHDLTEVHHDGMTYWLQSDDGLRFYTLYRAPLEQA